MGEIKPINCPIWSSTPSKDFTKSRICLYRKKSQYDKNDNSRHQPKESIKKRSSTNAIVRLKKPAGFLPSVSKDFSFILPGSRVSSGQEIELEGGVLRFCRLRILSTRSSSELSTEALRRRTSVQCITRHLGACFHDQLPHFRPFHHINQEFFNHFVVYLLADQEAAGARFGATGFLKGTNQTVPARHKVMVAPPHRTQYPAVPDGLR